LGGIDRVVRLPDTDSSAEHRRHGSARWRNVFNGTLVKAAAILFFFAAVSANADSLGQSLIDAVRNGDLAHTQQLVEQWRATGKPFPIAPDDKPLLFLAIEGREKTHPEIVELLLANGADVQTKGPQGMTALHWAAQHGYAERTEQLLQHHPQIEATDDFGRTPLLVAHSLSAEKLLAAHANWIALDKFGNSAMHYAAEHGVASHLEALYRAGFTVIDARNNAGLTPLHFATLAGETAAAKWLLDHGANKDAVTAAPYDYLPLDFAPGYGNEYRVPAGISVAAIAAKRNEETKWSSGRYHAVKDLLAERGAVAPWQPSPILLIFFGVIMAVFFIAFMSGIFFLDARMTGWHALAQRFPAASEPANIFKRQNGGVGTIGLVQMRGLLRAAATDQGLYLAFPKMLRAGHAPLLISWSQLKITDDKTILGIRVLTLQVGEPKIARVVLRGGIAGDVAAYIR
jgi:ankyrin repeat protein